VAKRVGPKFKPLPQKKKKKREREKERLLDFWLGGADQD
jgi:hypothetical protein